MPTGESGEEEEGNEGEDNGHDAAEVVSWMYRAGVSEKCLQKVGENDSVLEGRCHPDQVQWILVDVDALRKSGGIVRAEESTVCVCAQSEVSNADFQRCLSNNVGDGRCNTRIDLCRIVVGCVIIVVEIDEEDAGNERRG